MQPGQEHTLYFIKASWNYVTRGVQPSAKIVITIEEDDRSLLNQRI